MKSYSFFLLNTIFKDVLYLISNTEHDTFLRQKVSLIYSTELYYTVLDALRMKLVILYVRLRKNIFYFRVSFLKMVHYIISNIGHFIF